MTPQRRFSILILGSTGAFGAKIAERLATSDALDLILAGRTGATLAAQADALSKAAGRAMRTAVLDADLLQASDLTGRGVDLLINASGPYRPGRYGAARAAVAAGCHYVDLADSRPFVV